MYYCNVDFCPIAESCPDFGIVILMDHRLPQYFVNIDNIGLIKLIAETGSEDGTSRQRDKDSGRRIERQEDLPVECSGVLTCLEAHCQFQKVWQ